MKIESLYDFPRCPCGKATCTGDREFRPACHPQAAVVPIFRAPEGVLRFDCAVCGTTGAWFEIPRPDGKTASERPS